MKIELTRGSPEIGLSYTFSLDLAEDLIPELGLEPDQLKLMIRRILDQYLPSASYNLELEHCIRFRAKNLLNLLKDYADLKAKIVEAAPNTTTPIITQNGQQ